MPHGEMEFFDPTGVPAQKTYHPERVTVKAFLDRLPAGASCNKQQ
jgi:hypothetical protein